MTLSYRAVDWSFTVHADVVHVQATVDRVLVDLRDDGPAEHAYRLRSPRPGAPGVLELDGAEVARSVDEALLYATLLWHVNRGVVQSGDAHVLLHAAAACTDDGRAVLLPAPMESGKTTLVAGLVSAGLSYLTDEAAAVQPADLRLTAYPKPLSVDDGSWDVLAHLRPEMPSGSRHLMDAQWQVPASSFGRVATGGDPVLVVLPRYEEGAPTRLTPVSRADALVELLHSRFEPERAAARDLDVLARLARACSCYRLVSGDLDEAVGSVLGLAELG